MPKYNEEGSPTLWILWQHRQLKGCIHLLSVTSPQLIQFRCLCSHIPCFTGERGLFGEVFWAFHQSGCGAAKEPAEVCACWEVAAWEQQQLPTDRANQWASATWAHGLTLPIFVPRNISKGKEKNALVSVLWNLNFLGSTQKNIFKLTFQDSVSMHIV